MSFRPTCNGRGWLVITVKALSFITSEGLKRQMAEHVGTFFPLFSAPTAGGDGEQRFPFHHL